MKDLLFSQHQIEPGMVAVIGIPSDENSSFLRGASRAPRKIRQVLNDGSANLCSEKGIDFGEELRFIDLGDMDMFKGMDMFANIESRIESLLDQGLYVLSLGGDHAITYPILKIYGQRYERLNILHFDAHPDLYQTFEGNPYSHACPFARIMEENLASRLVQIGIRTLNGHQRKQVERFGVEVFEMRQWRAETTISFDGPVYLTLDLDALDPAFAPGVSHREPGGLSTRDILHVIQNIDAPIVGADIVEFNPRQDVQDLTAVVAAKFLKEISAQMIETTRGHKGPEKGPLNKKP